MKPHKRLAPTILAAMEERRKAKQALLDAVVAEQAVCPHEIVVAGESVIFNRTHMYRVCLRCGREEQKYRYDRWAELANSPDREVIEVGDQSAVLAHRISDVPFFNLATPEPEDD